MNNKFIVVNDKVVVLDEYNNTKTVNFQNNISEILQEENTIERIENLNKDIEYDINRVNKKSSGSKIWCYSPLITNVIGLGAALVILDKIVAPEVINTIFGEMSDTTLATLSVGVFTTPLTMWLSINELLNRKKAENELNALKSMKMYVYDRLLNEQNNLETLKTTNNNNNNENSNYIDGAEVCVSYDKNFNEEFNKQANFYYHAGYSARKYKKYLKKGNLEEKLRRYYSDDEIKEVKEIMKKLDL